MGQSINLMPSTTKYMAMLKMVVDNSTNTNDVKWAELELCKINEQINKVV